MALRFSIVMPTLNRADMLLAALDSVRMQDWPDVEIIVVDGGSTDNTLEILKGISGIRVLSGPDRGVYDALNKGIAAATGDVVGLLNSDDRYENGAFAAAARGFAGRTDIASVCGTATLVEDDRTTAVFSRDSDKTLASPHTIFIGSCIPNARFFRREALQQIGPFNLDYRYVSDRDFLARFCAAGLQTAAIPEAVYRYQQHPDSLTFGGNRQRQLAIWEELLLLARNWRGKSGGRFDQAVAALEGRCRVRLIGADLKRGDLLAAINKMVSNETGLSLAPFASIARASLDVSRQLITRQPTTSSTHRNDNR